MKTMDLRHKLIENINMADERLLIIVNAVFESYQKTSPKEEVVAYSVNGVPLTKKEYIELNDQAEAEYHQGEFSTHKEVKEKFRSRRDL